MFRIEATDLSKKFNERLIFKNVGFELQSGQSLVVTGQNGSGKTTLMRIISGLLSPSEGRLTFFKDNREIDTEEIFKHIGLVGPYLQLYNNLTALENLAFFSKIRGLGMNRSKILELTKQVGLEGREMDYVKNYSSGMIQRLKFVFALIHEPPILLVDEPTSNLDEKGMEIVYGLLNKQMENRILIVATNNPEESRFGQTNVHVGLQ
jgi:heme exporter protein A